MLSRRQTSHSIGVVLLLAHSLLAWSFSTVKMSSSIASGVVTSAKRILFDAPVSNNGAKCRIIVYKKEIAQSELSVVSPQEIGGLKSTEYLAINPLGKMPSFVCKQTNTVLAESDTICRYLLDAYPQGPSFQPNNPKSNLIARIHDMYMTTIQGCMYKAGPPFGPFYTRKDALAEYIKHLDIIEGLINSSDGMYLCGSEVSLADATLFPSVVFAYHMLPKFDVNPPLPPKMERWFLDLREKDPVFKRVNDEIMSGLNSWEERKRWDTLLGAGWRDEEPRTIFDKIISREIPATVVKEDNKVIAFKDINPVAPAHVLIIPKDRNGLTRLGKANEEHAEILGRLLVTAAEISRDKSLGFGDGARIVINDGPDGGQEVMHLHVHVLGGRLMTWPPG